jgi:HD-GYP domain-containing protein (c-di-GMP phosphodiesterase class II)
LKDKENIEEESLKVVIQHHENIDGTGYPYGIGGDEIDLYGKLSRIIDVYDAITTRRCYAGSMNPFDALKEMREGMISCFDMELFKEFVSFLGAKDSQKIKDDDEIVCLKT